MPTPAHTDWKTLSSSNNSLVPHTIKNRQLWALATIVTQRNPDGTVKGT